MNDYIKNIKLSAEDVDFNRKWRPSSIFTFMQRTAISHTEILGVGRNKTLDKGLLWVLTGVSLNMKKYPSYDDNVVIKTWPGKTLHVIFPRFYSFYDTLGNIYGTAESTWVIIDKETRSIIFPSEHNILINSNDSTYVIPKQISSPTIWISEYEKEIKYSDIDLNCHMTNAKYIDLVCDTIFTPTLNTLSVININFISECMYGMKLHISCHISGYNFSVFGTCNDRIIFKSCGELT